LNLPADILAFWFEGVDDSTPIDKGKRPFNKWFKAGKALDREIRERFEGDLNNAFAGKYKEWEQSPRGALAVVLLYDQLTRNMYRDTPGMYMADAPAQELALQLTSGKKERTLSLIERVFVYMPLMHAEDIRAQCLSVGYFTELVEESRKKNPGNTHYFSRNPCTLGYHRTHRASVPPTLDSSSHPPHHPIARHLP